MNRLPGRRDDDAATPVAEGLAWHVQRWALALGASPARAERLGQMARALSVAEDAGHACLSLARVAEVLSPPCTTDALRSELADSPLVGRVARPQGRPLVLDGGERLYLHRLFDLERRLAIRLAQALAHPPEPIGPSAVRRLHELFGLSPGSEGVTTSPDEQALAVALALRQRLTVISGGPGTGKTTTVMRLLACLLTQDPNCRIALAAPTGKAAARLTEAILERAAGEWPSDLAVPVPTPARTIHRWLGATRDGFAHHAGRPLPIDALVVDEASMMDLALATALLEAVPPHARIVLLGDRDQLSAVEAGAVFAELATLTALSPTCRDDLARACGSAPDDATAPALPNGPGLGDVAIAFTRSRRFAPGSPIAQLAQAIRLGQADAAQHWLREGPTEDLDWISADAPDLPRAAADRARAGYADYVAAIRSAPTDLGIAWSAFNRFRVLCAVRGGPRGVHAINELLSRHLRAALSAGSPPADAPLHSNWFPGRPILIQRNDPALGLFNGDVGLSWPDAEGRVMVHFPDGTGGWRALAPPRLPPHETAFAMTVHKSQGSEFDEVLFLLPEGTGPGGVTRELLYTAVTRARRRVIVCASAERLTQAVKTPAARESGLLVRLSEVGPGAVPP